MNKINLCKGQGPAGNKDNGKQSAAHHLPYGDSTYHNNAHDEIYLSAYPWQWMGHAGVGHAGA